MQFSWAESPGLEGDCGSDGKSGGDFATYENLYGGELPLFDLFNGNLNELDYLTDLSVATEAGSDSSSTQAGMPSDQPLDLLFVKNEPSSPQSFTSSSGSRTPSSPGESSGPSSPETLFQHLTPMMEATINPFSLNMPSGLQDASSSDPLLVEVKKQQGAKRARTGQNEDDESSVRSPTTPSGAVPEEERNVKRQRSSLSRLIKNRESAQKSRLRKKLYIEDLEAKVKSLTVQNEMFSQENNALKEEINFLTKFINKTPGLAEEIAQNRPKGTVTPIRNVKAAGVCLLIVLFSFGLFFNNVQQFGDHGPALPFEGGMREPIPEVLPFGGERRYGRMLKSFKDADVPSLATEVDEAGSDLTQIYPKRRLPPVDVGPLDSVIQRNKKVGTGLSPYKKIKLEAADTMDVVDSPSCGEELTKGFISMDEHSSYNLATTGNHGPRNDTGAETTGFTDN